MHVFHTREIMRLRRVVTWVWFGLIWDMPVFRMYLHFSCFSFIVVCNNTSQTISMIDNFLGSFNRLILQVVYFNMAGTRSDIFFSS